MDTDSCHQRMGPCRPRAFKELAEELTTSANDIFDRSGSEKQSEAGYSPAKLRTDETVDHGSAELAPDTRINENVLAGTFILTRGMTTRMAPETHGIAVTCPTDSRTEGGTVRIIEYLIFSNRRHCRRTQFANRGH